MNINDIILIISIIIVILYIFMFLTGRMQVEQFAAGGEIDQYLGTYLKKGYVVYPGTIVMWSGNIANIPIGYLLCDGTNGTPDLRDKFIVGASTNSKYKIGDKGGNDNVILSVDQLPSHNHTGTTSSNGIGAGCSRTAGNGNFLVGNPDNKGNCGNTNHIHTFTTDPTGNNKAIDIRPNYYALAFIIKTAN